MDENVGKKRRIRIKDSISAYYASAEKEIVKKKRVRIKKHLKNLIDAIDHCQNARQYAHELFLEAFHCMVDTNSKINYSLDDTSQFFLLLAQKIKKEILR